MNTTRRSFMMGVTCAALSTAQSDRPLRIEQHGDTQRPAIAVFLPGSKFPSAVIEMPEHAWRKEKAGGEPAWFYKMYGSDPKLQGAVTWSNRSGVLSYSMRTPSGFLMNSTATVEADGVAITHDIASNSSRPLAEIQAPTCVKLYRPFTDVFLERTYVHHSNGIELLASESPKRLTSNAEEWLPCRYIVGCGKDATPPPKLIERLDGVTRYFKSKAADAAIIATESTPSGWIAATHGLYCPSLFTNPARTCHHADPQALSLATGKARLRLKVYFLKGSVERAFDLVLKRDRNGDC